MRRSRKSTRKTTEARRPRKLGLGLLSAIWLYAMTGFGAAALDFKCVEPSRYKNLLQVFEDNPTLLSSYFDLDRTQQPDMNACRALVVTGTIRDGDAAALIDNVIQNKGWLDVLYLSFDGVYLKEEIKLAEIVRGFSLKTRVLHAAPFSYAPDFATLWGQPAAREIVPASTPISELSPLNRGLKAFAKRRDLALPIVKDHSVCIESCAGVWMSGVHRRAFPAPPIAARPAAALAATEIVTARPRAALVMSLEGGKIAAPNNPSWNKLVTADDAPILPPAVDHMIRDKCAAELIAGEALEGRVASAADDLARNDFRDVRSTPLDLLAQFDALRLAAVRLQRCVARAFESQRLAAFRRLCDPSCDKTKLVASFDRTAGDFVDKTFTISTLFGAGPSDSLGGAWSEEEPGGSGTWTRRGSSSLFDAVWTLPQGSQASATLEVARAGNSIVAVRSQAEGRCLYQGALAADDKSVRGDYVCSWTPGAYAWSATIGEPAAPPSSP